MRSFFRRLCTIVRLINNLVNVAIWVLSITSEKSGRIRCTPNNPYDWLLFQPKLAWMRTVTTLADPRKDFQLENFRIEIVQNDPISSAVATLTHTFACVNRYAIRLTQPDQPEFKGEIIFNAPKVGDDVTLDLHMVPGILNLQNCRTYSLHIYPDNFPEHVSDSGKWHEGAKWTFEHVTPDGEAPNVIELDDVVKISAETNRAEIVWGSEPFSCSEVEVTISSLRFLYRKHTHLEEEVFVYF